MSDHNETGTWPTPADLRRGRLPGQRRVPTAGACLTSEGSLVRYQLCPPRSERCGGVETVLQAEH